MKTIKPTRLGLLFKVFEHDGDAHLVVTLLLCFPFDSPQQLLTEQNLWRLAGAALGPDTMLDECMLKLRGELLVTGHCHTAGAVPRPAASVRVALGAIDKTLHVVGDRRWTTLGMTDPEPFTEMPIAWRNAFGGEGFAANPLGKGSAPVRGETGPVHPLPNIEDPRHHVQSPRDKPDPAGFEPYDQTWPQRASKAGTYDAAWLEQRYPDLPRDFDASFYNVAPPDQQIDGYFRGDEPFVIENMHPDEARLEGVLPGVATRCFMTQKTTAGDTFREISTRLDTIRLFPREKRGILVFRGIAKIHEDDAADVVHLVAGCEKLGEPRPAAHYQAVLEQRLDKKRGHLYALRDSDLMPPADPAGHAVADDPRGDMAPLITAENLVQKNMRRKVERQIEDAKAELRAKGINPDGRVPELPPEELPPDFDELPAHVERQMDEAERLKETIAAQRAETEQRARAECAKHGLDYDAMMRAAQKEAGGPPKFSAKKEIERLHDMARLAKNGGVRWPELEARLAVPDLEQQLVKVEERMLAAYRKLAHHFPTATRLEGDPAKRLREEVIAGHREGHSFAGRDLTGADLAHLDLRGIDLAGALLEAAVLTGADLRGARLAGAVLVRADLVGADLTGAQLAGANFGEAMLCDAKLRGGADLTGATLAKADLSGADLEGAQLSNADLSGARVEGADLRRVTARGLIVMGTDLSGASLEGADLTKCVFIDTIVAGVDFRGANLTASVFVNGKGDGAVFRGAKLDNLRIVKDSSFAGADFRGASMKLANLRGAHLAGSDFTEADLTSAELSECDFTSAHLDHAILVDARLVRTNLSGATLVGADLMQSVLQKARLDGANLENASLFRADAAKILGNAETSLKGANVKHVRFVAARRTDEPG